MLQKNFRLRMIISTFRMYSMDNQNGVRGIFLRQTPFYTSAQYKIDTDINSVESCKYLFFIDIPSRREDMRAGE